MPRGQPANEGDTRTSANGYHYTRTKNEWRLTHHLLAEQILKRALEPKERVYFIDGDRTNLKCSNIGIAGKRPQSVKARRARLEARLEEIQAQLDALDEED
jgi:hypothetical protein